MIKYFKHLEDIALDREVERSSKETPKTSQDFLYLDSINILVMKRDVLAYYLICIKLLPPHLFLLMVAFSYYTHSKNCELLMAL